MPLTIAIGRESLQFNEIDEAVHVREALMRVATHGQITDESMALKLQTWRLILGCSRDAAGYVLTPTGRWVAIALTDVESLGSLR